MPTPILCPIGQVDAHDERPGLGRVAPDRGSLNLSKGTENVTARSGSANVPLQRRPGGALRKIRHTGELSLTAVCISRKIRGTAAGPVGPRSTGSLPVRFLKEIRGVAARAWPGARRQQPLDFWTNCPEVKR